MPASLVWVCIGDLFNKRHGIYNMSATHPSGPHISHTPDPPPAQPVELSFSSILLPYNHVLPAHLPSAVQAHFDQTKNITEPPQCLSRFACLFLRHAASSLPGLDQSPCPRPFFHIFRPVRVSQLWIKNVQKSQGEKGGASQTACGLIWLGCTTMLSSLQKHNCLLVDWAFQQPQSSQYPIPVWSL